MPNLELKVTILKGALDVDQSGSANQMEHGKSGTIVWKLTGNASSGTFNATDATNPGFAWKKLAPHVGIFGQPTLTHNNTHIEVFDDNTDPNDVDSKGKWVYQLYATIEGIQYSTTLDRPTNPTIKNN